MTTVPAGLEPETPLPEQIDSALRCSQTLPSLREALEAADAAERDAWADHRAAHAVMKQAEAQFGSDSVQARAAHLRFEAARRNAESAMEAAKAANSTVHAEENRIVVKVMRAEADRLDALATTSQES